jgi:hypothetical protein
MGGGLGATSLAINSIINKGVKMPQQIDDLEAVRIIVSTLEKFDKPDQERIIRWAREKLGLNISQQPLTQSLPQTPTQINQQLPENRAVDLKSFINEKNPTSDMQFAATVAYYYKFEAPENQRKDTIDSDTLQDAARLANRKRLSKPSQTLINASFNGMIDKTDAKGVYKINTVGENLVAMTLPQGNSSTKVRREQKTQKKKTN